MACVVNQAGLADIAENYCILLCTTGGNGKSVLIRTFALSGRLAGDNSSGLVRFCQKCFEVGENQASASGFFGPVSQGQPFGLALAPQAEITFNQWPDM